MPRIAIVDDQEEYLEEICNLIEKFYFKNGIPYVVNTFSNAQLLLYEMEEKLYFDIYLLDIEMPGINGLSLAEKIRSMDDAGYIKASEDGITDTPGIFVAGDVRTKNLRQVVTAVSDGANGVYSILSYMEKEEI